MLLLDSDILIDILRGRPSALAWSTSTVQQTTTITVFSEMELLAGCRDLPSQNLTRQFISRCTILYPSSDAMRRAVQLYADLRLSHGIGANDSLIAQTAIEHGLPLHTFNVKHYRPVPGLITIQPYTR